MLATALPPLALEVARGAVDGTVERMRALALALALALAPMA